MALTGEGGVKREMPKVLSFLFKLESMGIKSLGDHHNVRYTDLNHNVVYLKFMESHKPIITSIKIYLRAWELTQVAQHTFLAYVMSWFWFSVPVALAAPWGAALVAPESHWVCALTLWGLPTWLWSAGSGPQAPQAQSTSLKYTVSSSNPWCPPCITYDPGSSALCNPWYHK